MIAGDAERFRTLRRLICESESVVSEQLTVAFRRGLVTDPEDVAALLDKCGRRFFAPLYELDGLYRGDLVGNYWHRCVAPMLAGIEQ